MDGIVTARRVEEGEVAVIGVQNSPGTVLLTISDMSVVEAELEVDETSIPSVKLGQEAEVRLDAYPNQTFRGVVTEVGSSPLTGRRQRGDQVQGQGPPGRSAGRHQARPLGARRHPDRLPRQRAGGAAPGAGGARHRAQARGPGARQRPARGGGGLPDGGGKARFQPIKTGLIGDLSIEVTPGAQGGRDGDHRPLQGPARARARRPREARGADKKKEEGRDPKR